MERTTLQPGARVPFAGAALGGGPASGDQWSTTKVLPTAGVPGLVFAVSGLLIEPGILVISADRGATTITVVETRERDETTYVFHLGPGGSEEVRWSGAVRITAVSDVDACTISAHLAFPGYPLAGVFDSTASPLNVGGGLAPGPWVAPSALDGATPPFRSLVTITPLAVLGALNSGVEAQLVNTGGVEFARFMVATPLTMCQPPRFRFRFRHPGGVADVRSVILAYRRF